MKLEEFPGLHYSPDLLGEDISLLDNVLARFQDGLGVYCGQFYMTGDRLPELLEHSSLRRKPRGHDIRFSMAFQSLIESSLLRDITALAVPFRRKSA